MEIEIRHLFVSPGHNFKGRHGEDALDHGVVDQEEVECVAGSGIRGDRYFDHKEDFKGQITFFAAEVFEEVKRGFDLPELDPGAFRRNVVISGVQLNDLIGRRFRIGDVEFEGSEEAKPCYWMNRACAEGVEELLRGKGGLRASIRRNGTLRRGPAELDLA